MPKISFMIHTASADWFLYSQGIPSYFAALCNNLSHQSFTDFELIYVDTFHEENLDKFKEISAGLPFQVKHVAVHKEHRYWYDQGYCYIAAAKNTGILYADGELCVSCDDAEFFPATFLGRYWEHYLQGHLTHALHKRLRSVRVAASAPEMPIQGDEYVNDHRWKHLEGGQSKAHRHGTWLYAGASFSMANALDLNGYNERMDGCKSLDDCDFGNRLRVLGCRFMLDKDAFAYILDHGSYADMDNGQWPAEPSQDVQSRKMPLISKKKIDNLIAVENHGMLRCAIELMDYIANKQPLSKQHLDIIQADTIKYRGFDPLAPANKEKFDIWLRTPTFDLRAQREELRRSPEWKW